MNIKHKYRLTLEDEATLEKKINFSAKFPVYILVALLILMIFLILSTIFIYSTPIKNFLPGYLKKSERASTEEQHLRLDSLLHTYEVNQAYLNNVFRILYSTEPDSTYYKTQSATLPLSVDSLLDLSDEERNFIEEIRERDKYNIAVITAADAETMMFGNLNTAAIIPQKDLESIKPEIILPSEGLVSAVADGKVISIASSPKDSGGFEVIIQHPKGFLSKTSRLSNLFVAPGERVSVGQIIGSSFSHSGRNNNIIGFELWHDGNPLIPSRYLNYGNPELTKK